MAQEVSQVKDLVVIFDKLFKGINVKDATTCDFAQFDDMEFIIRIL